MSLRVRWQFAVVLCLLAAGCRSLTGQGPIPKSVATCRQYSQQGTSAMERGDWSHAEALLARAIRLARRFRRDTAYAETLWHRGAAQEAVAQLEEARRVAADDVSLAVRTGELYLAMGQVENSQLSDQALELDPKSAPNAGPARLQSRWARSRSPR